ncbi:MAG: hemerythrin domain-containing protein [Sandaracinaceae bacterium]|nr:hemerythrin domain-containing protein [Sandaracinaceae bacterium]
MRPTERLMEEHRAILRALDVLERIADRYGDAPSAHAEDARAVVGFIRGFADELHHGKEEAMLFPAMEEVGHSLRAGPIGVMLTEHDEGRALVRAMEGALDQAEGGADSFAAAAYSFAELLRAHIDKEDGILFPLAERALPEKVRAALCVRFEEHDGARHAAAYRAHLDTLARLEERLDASAA